MNAIGINILVGIISSVIGAIIVRLWDCWKKKKAGLTGQASKIIKDLGTSVQKSEGCYYLSRDGTENYKLTSHLYERATGEVIATCFRDNPTTYGERDHARLLPKGVEFARLTTLRGIQDNELKDARDKLSEFVKHSEIIAVGDNENITKIDGIFAELADKTYFAFVTFPNLKLNKENRGVVFYGNIAKAFFLYYKDLKDSNKSVAEKEKVIK